MENNSKYESEPTTISTSVQTKPVMCYHRGDTSIAQENTLEAIIGHENENETENKLVEIDVRCDTFELYVHHDKIGKNQVKRLCKNIQYDELTLKYSFEREITTLRKVFETIDKSNLNISICLDLKLDTGDVFWGFVALVKLITRYKKYVKYVSSFNIKVLTILHKHLENIVDFGLFITTSQYDWKDYVDKINPKYLISRYNDFMLNGPFENNGEKVVVYTIHQKDIHTVLGDKIHDVDIVIVDTYKITHDSNKINKEKH